MNVIVLTVERCGCSWMGAIISEVHKHCHGDPIIWNYEISRCIATRPKYYIPKGYCSVYYVRPEQLLEKEYDKIIVLHRDLESLKQKLFQYHFGPNQKVLKKHEPFFEEIEFYYNLTFNKKITNERLLWVELSDLNNHCISTFNKIFDFLEFPKKTRPILLPINPPERDWDVSGSVIKSGLPLDIYQQKMLAGKDYISHLYKHVEESQFVNPVGEINPYKISPEEWELQGARTFRIEPKSRPDAMRILGYL